MTTTHIEAVLFDLDDTLIDYRGASEQGVRHVADAVGRLSEFPSILQRWREGPVHYDRFLRGEITYVQMAEVRVQHALNQPLTAQQARELYDTYFQGYRSAWRAFDDVLPCLRALSGVRLGLITNGRAVEQIAKLRHIGLDSFFQLIHTAEGGGDCKPAPQVFRRACDELQVPYDRALYVGDNRDVDYRGAVNAGLRALWLNRVEVSLPAVSGEIRTLGEVGKHL